MGYVGLLADDLDLTVRVDQPAPAPRGFGLFSAATVLNQDDYGRWTLGIEYAAADPYVPVGGTDGQWPGPADCVTQYANADAVVKGDTRAIDSDWAHANAFTVYAAIECPGGPGSTGPEMTNRVRALLEYNEARQVENAVWSGALGNNQYLASADADDLTPAAGPVGGHRALSLLAEGMHGRLGGGHVKGVIHAPVEVWPFLPYVSRQGAQLQTLLGDAVAYGAGYGLTGPDLSTPLAADEWRWVYGSGPVVIRRGPIQVRGPVYDQGMAATFYLAERMYSVTIDGNVVAVRTALTPEPT